jgi:hypothetical protein
MSSPKAATKSARRAKPAARPAVKAAAKPLAKPAQSDASAEATRLAAELERGLANGQASLSPEALQALMGAVCRTYSAQIEAGGDFYPVKPRGVTSTDIMITASGLLKSQSLAVFELGMWQSWTGR